MISVTLEFVEHNWECLKVKDYSHKIHCIKWDNISLHVETKPFEMKAGDPIEIMITEKTIKEHNIEIPKLFRGKNANN